MRSAPLLEILTLGTGPIVQMFELPSQWQPPLPSSERWNVQRNTPFPVEAHVWHEPSATPEMSTSNPFPGALLSWHLPHVTVGTEQHPSPGHQPKQLPPNSTKPASGHQSAVMIAASCSSHQRIIGTRGCIRSPYRPHIPGTAARHSRTPRTNGSCNQSSWLPG